MLAHADKVPRESALDKALWCTDPLTGLVVAAALIRPEKKLALIDAAFVLNRFKEKGFARGANREQIQACQEELGLTLEEFVDDRGARRCRGSATTSAYEGRRG